MSSVFFWAAIINYLAALVAVGVASWLWCRYRTHSFYLGVIGMLCATSVVSVATGLMLSDRSHLALWVRFLMVGQLGQVATLWAVPASLRHSPEDRSRLTGLWMVVGVMMVALWSTLGLQVGPSEMNVPALELGPLGKVLYILTLIAMAIGVAQMEMVWRATPEPMRYQIKYAMIGLGSLAAFQIYFSIKILLMPVWESGLFLVGGVIYILSIGLVMFGAARGGILEMTSRLYVSPHALIGSATFLIVGFYLLAVGSMAEWFRETGREVGPAISLLTVFFGVIGLVLLLASRSTRIALRDTVLRHFYRSKYDYRLKWLEVTEAFQGADTVDIILDRLRELLARTFSAGTMSVWLYVEADRRFHQVRSVNAETPPSPLDPDAALIRRLRQSQEPIVLNAAGQEDDRPSEQVLYVPVHRGERGLIAFVALRRGLEGLSYGLDDRDLLRAIAFHVGLLLTSAHMAEEQASAAELHAFHRFASFCLHDLKNLAGKLSLVVQNAQVHGDSPQFQQAAMKTVSSTAQQMMDLIGKLSPRSTQGHSTELVDVNAMINEVACQLSSHARPPMTLNLTEIPPLAISRTAFQQVLHNILDNAQQAGGTSNHVTVRTTAQGDMIRVLVQDRGMGMAPERLRTLFRPFITTKEHGTGIGLYQCKATVELYGGTIRIESRIGEGTSVWLELPAASVRQADGMMRTGGKTVGL